MEKPISQLAMNLKKQLGFFLDDKNLSLSELAKRSGVSKQTLSDWASGREPRKLTQVRKVAQVLGTTVDNLCFGNGRDGSLQRVTELEALLGNDWISGLFEIRFRRIKK
jgi:transcriptional regulator with XRE-family HTH domain